jgi:sugar phosphate isomerase/epimerase
MENLSRRKFSKRLILGALAVPVAVQAESENAGTAKALSQPPSKSGPDHGIRAEENIADHEEFSPAPGYKVRRKNSSTGRVRLGGPVYQDEFKDPGTWIEAHKIKGYSAAYCPLDENADDATVEAYRDAAKKADLIIAEAGAWSNPISPDEKEAKAAVEFCIRRLELADRIGAKCCVNVSGSRAQGEGSHGLPHPDNLTRDTFDLIVEITRRIIDAVKPTRSFFTLEPMPAAYPESVDSYLELIKAVDRPRFAVHLDPVNIVSSPMIYYHNGAMIREAFRRLGPYIRSCHAKDTLLLDDLTVRLAEAVPGRGTLDYSAYLQEIARLDNVPLMLEHLERGDYPEAAEFIRSVGRENGLGFA